MKAIQSTILFFGLSVINLSANGQPCWLIKQLPQPGGAASVLFIANGSDSSFFVSSRIGQGVRGKYSVDTIKLSHIAYNGSILYNITYVDTLGGISSMRVATSGNIYLQHFYGKIDGSEVTKIAKFNKVGKLLWDKDVTYLGTSTLPGGFAVDNKERLFVSGYTNDKAGRFSFVANYSNKNFARNWIYQGDPAGAQYSNLKIDSKSNIYALNYYEVGYYGVQITKLSKAGAVSWIDTLYPGNTNETNIALADDSELYVYGTATNDTTTTPYYFYLSKLNVKKDKTRFVKQYGYSQYPLYLDFIVDFFFDLKKNIIILSRLNFLTQEYTSSNVTKIDRNTGQVIWDIDSLEQGKAGLFKGATDKSNCIYAVGLVDTIAKNQNNDQTTASYILKFDSNGNEIYHITDFIPTDSLQDYLWQNCIVGLDNSLYVGGQHIIFLPVEKDTLFIAKYGNCASPVQERSSCTAMPDVPPLFNVFPNPAFGAFTITNPASELLTVRVLDMMGIPVKTTASGNVKIIVDLSGDPSGFYLVQVHNGKNIFTKNIELIH